MGGELQDPAPALLDALEPPAADPDRPIPVWSVRARKPLTDERIIAAADAEPDTDQADRVLHLHRRMQYRTRAYAAQLETMSEFFTEDPDTAGRLDDAYVAALKIATAMRCSTRRAQGMIRDAHLAVEIMPETFSRLGEGDLPEEWHHHLLRKVRRLDEEQIRLTDHHVATWDLPSISRSQFDRHLSHLIALITADMPTPPPQAQRNVTVEVDDPQCGTATMSITGPIPEIAALARRLDSSARTVQQAQRHALREDGETPVPFDLDDDVRDRGRALPRSALRYAILTRSVLDIDPVEETAQPVTINVTVPALTLLGATDAPGMLDGTTPIPADQARALAGETGSTWHRILTDPATGAYLPTTATTYKPSAQMREQLRLRHPVCAAPGCHRPTALAAEDDHIVEFDHGHPAGGGQTTLVNLHRLCWRHHQLKTAGRIDPQRDPERGPDPGTAPPGPITTDWEIDSVIRTRTCEDTDLATPHLVAALDVAWQAHQRRREDVERRVHGSSRRSDPEPPAGDAPADLPPF
ncbi:MULTISPECIES: HNH endonuclease [unclassified Brachybacterium]|uniref:HNH endonuclease signature motif containing protein n=1 Tax=unclassified Brachybacterium TaxID=2623841 RepID=UPI003619893F